MAHMQKLYQVSIIRQCNNKYQPISGPTCETIESGQIGIQVHTRECICEVEILISNHLNYQLQSAVFTEIFQ